MNDRDDLNALLSGAVDVATDLLADGTEFAPFALAMQADDGEIFHIEPEDEEVLDNPPNVVIATLREGLKEAAAEGRWRAVAVVADVTLEDDDGEPITSAIHVAMEHVDGEPVTCIVPYSINEETVELDELVAEPGESVVFERPPSPEAN